MPRSQGGWVYDPHGIPSEAGKKRIAAQADALIETTLKPRYVKPPSAEPQFNYITDLNTRWRGNYLYFCATYQVAGPGADPGVAAFETRFARLEYTGPNRFNLAFMRHTGRWVELYQGLTLEESLDSIRDEAWFQP